MAHPLKPDAQYFAEKKKEMNQSIRGAYDGNPWVQANAGNRSLTSGRRKMQLHLLKELTSSFLHIKKLNLACMQSFMLFCFFYDKVNGMIKISVQEVVFLRQSDRWLLGKYPLRFHIS